MELEVNPDAVDAPELLRDVDRALEIFASEVDGGEPFMFGDAGVPRAWLVRAPFYDELSRARAWLQADGAVREADPGDADLVTARDEAARDMLDRSRPSTTFDGLRLVRPEAIVRDLPEIARHIRAGTLATVAVGRYGEPEAVLIGTEPYTELVRAHMLWRQSEPFLATLDPAVHKPLAKSTPLDLEELMSRDAMSQEIWERIQDRKAARKRPDG